MNDKIKEAIEIANNEIHKLVIDLEDTKLDIKQKILQGKINALQTLLSCTEAFLSVEKKLPYKILPEVREAACPTSKENPLRWLISDYNELHDLASKIIAQKNMEIEKLNEVNVEIIKDKIELQSRLAKLPTEKDIFLILAHYLKKISALNDGKGGYQLTMTNKNKLNEIAHAISQRIKGG